jgi:hypothetical protein
MPDSTRLLEQLQARVAAGDAAAARELSGRLQPVVAAMVRRALRFPSDGSPLAADVRAEVGRLGLTAWGELIAEDRSLVRFIAGCICARLIDRFRFTRGQVFNLPGKLETCRHENSRLPARETVSDWARLRN